MSCVVLFGQTTEQNPMLCMQIIASIIVEFLFPYPGNCVLNCKALPHVSVVVYHRQQFEKK
jgi:hypothetical protein